MTETDVSLDAIRDHYDRISVFYRALWGDHIHHGYWEDNESQSAAQLKLIERLAMRARIKRGSRVLDVGCGVGGSSLWLARELDCTVLGLTISPVQARMATEKAHAEKLDAQVSFAVADANHLDLEPESFDVVWVVECSEHLTDKQRFIENCARVLKPGGVLALCAWLKGDSANDDEHHARLVGDVCEGMFCPSLATKRDYTVWMSASGFVDIEAEDITRHVAKTWKLCAKLARRPEVKMMLHVSEDSTRRFVAAFDSIDRAYSEGAMAYGMFTARKE